ncbi:MAG: hypothetical protein ACYSSM_04780 [Planctomycetota bacterium]
MSSLRADVATEGIVLPREHTAQRLVSLQRIVDLRDTSVSVTPEVSEKLTELNGQALDLRLKGVVVEVVHARIIADG